MNKEKREEIRFELVKRINGIDGACCGDNFKDNEYMKHMTPRDLEIVSKMTKKEKQWIKDLILDVRFSFILKR